MKQLEFENQTRKEINLDVIQTRKGDNWREYSPVYRMRQERKIDPIIFLAGFLAL